MVGVLTQKSISFEQHCISCGICVQNYSAIIWGEGIWKEMFYVSDGRFPPPPSQFYQNGDRKACPSKNIGFSYLQFWVAIWLWHPCVLSENVKKIKMPCSNHRGSVLKHRWFCVCEGWELESGCHFVVGLFLFLMSKLHKGGALPRRIWCRKAQATLKIQTNKQKKIEIKNGYSCHLRLSG